MLQDEIERVKLEMETAYSNFEQVLDPDLIDCYIYELKAIQTRYSYLIGKAKELENKRQLEVGFFRKYQLKLLLSLKWIKNPFLYSKV